MSVFTSFVTKIEPVPHDPPNTVTIRKLAPKALGESQRVAQRRAIKDVQEMGGAAFIQEMSALSPGAVSEATEADPLITYDRELLVVSGLVEWSYTRKPNREAIDDLDEETLDFLARAILKLSRPALFGQGDEVRKND